MKKYDSAFKILVLAILTSIIFTSCMTFNSSFVSFITKDTVCYTGYMGLAGDESTNPKKLCLYIMNRNLFLDASYEISAEDGIFQMEQIVFTDESGNILKLEKTSLNSFPSGTKESVSVMLSDSEIASLMQMLRSKKLVYSIEKDGKSLASVKVNQKTKSNMASLISVFISNYQSGNGMPAPHVNAI